MAITGQQKPKTWWNDSHLFWYHIRRSTWFTVLWDWFKTLSAKVAEFILLVAVLWAGAKLYNPELTKWATFDSTMNTLQNLALDAAGIGLLLLISQAEKEGRTEGVGFAKFVAWSLIVSMIVNMSLSGILSTFGQNEKDVAWLIVLLIIARAVFAVLYGVVLNKLENRDETVGPEIVRTSDIWERIEEVQQAVQNGQVALRREVQTSLQQVVQSEVQKVVQSQSQMIITGVQEVVQSLVQKQIQFTVEQLSEVVQQQVQIQVMEQVQPLQDQFQEVVQFLEGANNADALKQLAERMQEVSSTVREMRTTITEVRTVTQRTPSSDRSVRITQGSSKIAKIEPPRVVQSTAEKDETELLSEPPRIRVPRYIEQQIELGRKPSLSEIVNQCKVSKNTAIGYRRNFFLDDEENETEEVEAIKIEEVSEE